MRGLLLQEYYTNRQLLLISFAILLPMIVFSEFTTGGGLVGIAVMSSQVTQIQSDGWLAYARTLPVSASKIVLGRYIFTIGHFLLFYTLGSTFYYFVYGVDEIEYLLMTVGAPLFIIFECVSIPLNMKFGFKKGILLSPLLIAPFIIVGMLIYFNMDISELMLFLAVTLLTVMAMISSFFVTVKVYRKKQY
ncbi:MAG: ABC-2 transporter permease [Bacilli bacterium]